MHLHYRRRRAAAAAALANSFQRRQVFELSTPPLLLVLLFTESKLKSINLGPEPWLKASLRAALPPAVPFIQHVKHRGQQQNSVL